MLIFPEDMQGEDISAFETAMLADGCVNMLTKVMRHFPPAQFIEVLRSTCRKAIASAADTVGLHLYKVSKPRTLHRHQIY